jgi:hypothetical protein
MVTHLIIPTPSAWQRGIGTGELNAVARGGTVLSLCSGVFIGCPNPRYDSRTK